MSSKLNYRDFTPINQAKKKQKPSQITPYQQYHNNPSKPCLLATTSQKKFDDNKNKALDPKSKTQNLDINNSDELYQLEQNYQKQVLNNKYDNSIDFENGASISPINTKKYSGSNNPYQKPNEDIPHSSRSKSPSDSFSKNYPTKKPPLYTGPSSQTENSTPTRSHYNKKSTTKLSGALMNKSIDHKNVFDGKHKQDPANSKKKLGCQKKLGSYINNYSKNYSDKNRYYSNESPTSISIKTDENNEIHDKTSYDMTNRVKDIRGNYISVCGSLNTNKSENFPMHLATRQPVVETETNKTSEEFTDTRLQHMDFGGTFNNQIGLTADGVEEFHEGMEKNDSIMDHFRNHNYYDDIVNKEEKIKYSSDTYHFDCKIEENLTGSTPNLVNDIKNPKSSELQNRLGIDSTGNATNQLVEKSKSSNNYKYANSEEASITSSVLAEEEIILQEKIRELKDTKKKLRNYRMVIKGNYEKGLYV